jgi:5-deoxy-D-glucuronate isomerase
LYPYSNTAPLPGLRAKGEGDKLFFRTATEEAVVRLSAENRIEAVEHCDLTTEATRQVQAASAHHIVVGSGNWRRDVYHFLIPSPQAHLQLRLGLTVHSGEGTWSSLPHDFENHPEPGFEEAFFYLLSGGNGRAIQVGRGMWCDGSVVDRVWPVQDRVFSVIPMGYHPVVGEPGVKVSYVWTYLAKKKAWEKI